METSSVNLMFVLWLVGLVTLPLWIYPFGRRGARVRERLEAPHRHPRPAVDVLAPAPPPVGRVGAIAFHDGHAAAAGAAPRRVEDVRRLLEERHATVAEVEETPDRERPYRVTLVRGAGTPRVPGGAVCEYDRGVVTGLFSALVGMPVEVEESSCRATGGLYCAFHVRVDLPEPKPRVPRLVRARELAARMLGRVAPPPRAPDRAAGAASGAAGPNQGAVQRSRNP